MERKQDSTKLWLTAIGVLMAFVLVACGGSDSPSPKSEPQGVAVPEPTNVSTATEMPTASAVII